MKVFGIFAESFLHHIRNIFYGVNYLMNGVDFCCCYGKIQTAGKTPKKIGDKLRELRIKKGYKSAETFSFDFEMSRVQYWRMEKGANITMASLIKVLDIHNVTLDDFFKGIE